jgi:hypothetical protein
MRASLTIVFVAMVVFAPLFGPGAAAEEVKSSVSVYPPRIMARQPLLARAMYGGEGEEHGSRLALYEGEKPLLSAEGKVIFLAHFEGGLGARGGWMLPEASGVSFSERARFGERALRMKKGSSLVYDKIPDAFDYRSGSVLMWVAPDTQTVFVTPDQCLYYEKADDGSLLSLSLSKHHLKASWKGRGRGDTGDKKSAMDAREWHLVGMSWGYPQRDLVTMFLDGGFWYSRTEKYRPGSRAAEIGIGTGQGRSEAFRGLIDEVMITRQALSEDEVLALYHAGRDGALPFPDQFMALLVDDSSTGLPLRVEYTPRNKEGREFPSVRSDIVIPEPPHAELFLGLGQLTTTPFDLIGIELTYDCAHPDSSREFPSVRMWDSPRCKSPEEDRGKPRKRVLESVRCFQLSRPGNPLVRVPWGGGEGAYYRFEKNAKNPPDRVDHVREFLDSLSVGFPQALMLFAETAQLDESTSDFDTSLIRYMKQHYGEKRPRYYECINEMIYAEGWGTERDNDSALVWDWRDGYYHTGGRSWTHMVEDTLSRFFEEASAIDRELRFGWFIDRQGGWNVNGTPSGVMEEWRQDSILLANEMILKHTGFLAFHDYFPISMGEGENSLAHGLTRAVGSLGWKHAYMNPRTWRLFAKYVGHPEWEMFQTEYNTAAADRSARMPARAERLFDTWAGAWANISNFILRARAGQIDKAMYFKAGYAYGDTPHATVNYAAGKAHRTVIEKTFGLFGGLLRDSTLAADSIWTYGFKSGKTAHNWGITGMPAFDALSTVSPDTDTVAVILVNRDWRHTLPLELYLEPPLTVDPEHDTALFYHVEFGPTSKGAGSAPDTSLLESWGKGYFYTSETKFDSTDVNFVCDTLPGFSQHMRLELGRAAFGVLEFPVRVKR